MLDIVEKIRTNLKGMFTYKVLQIDVSVLADQQKLEDTFCSQVEQPK